MRKILDINVTILGTEYAAFDTDALESMMGQLIEMGEADGKIYALLGFMLMGLHDARLKKESLEQTTH